MRRKLYTISWPRALYVAMLPGVGLWSLARRKRLSNDEPFTRQPRVIEIASALTALVILVAGFLASSNLLIYGGVLPCFVFLSRVILRLVIPRRFVSNEREFRLLILSFRSHLLVYALLAFLIYREEWLATAIVATILVIGTVVAAFLIRLMVHGLVDEDGAPIDTNIWPPRGGTMTTETRWPLA